MASIDLTGTIRHGSPVEALLMGNSSLYNDSTPTPRALATSLMSPSSANIGLLWVIQTRLGPSGEDSTENGRIPAAVSSLCLPPVAAPKALLSARHHIAPTVACPDSGSSVKGEKNLSLRSAFL